MSRENGEDAHKTEASGIISFVSDQGKQDTKIIKQAVSLGAVICKQTDDTQKNGKQHTLVTKEQQSDKPQGSQQLTTTRTRLNSDKVNEGLTVTSSSEGLTKNKPQGSQQLTSSIGSLNFDKPQRSQQLTSINGGLNSDKPKESQQLTSTIIKLEIDESPLPVIVQESTKALNSKQLTPVSEILQEKDVTQSESNSPIVRVGQIKVEYEAESNLEIDCSVENLNQTDQSVITGSQEGELKQHFICNTCGKKDGIEITFPTALSLAEHANKLHHKSPRMTGPLIQFTCCTEKINYCIFPVVQEEVYACRYGNCPKKFTCEELLNTHLAVCSWKAPRPIEYQRCQYRFCDRLFPDQERRKKHVKDVHVEHNIDIQDSYGAFWIIKSSLSEQNSVKCIAQSEEEHIQHEVFKEIQSFFHQTYQIKRIVFNNIDDFVLECEMYGDFIHTDVLSGTNLAKFGHLNMNQTISTVRRIYEEIKNSEGDFIVNINNIKCRMLHSGITIHNACTDCFIYIDDGERKEKEEATEVNCSSQNVNISKLKQDFVNGNPSVSEKKSQEDIIVKEKSSLKTVAPKNVEVDIGDLVFLYGKPDLNYSGRDEQDNPDVEGEIIYSDTGDAKNYAILSCDTFPNESSEKVFDTNTEVKQENLHKSSDELDCNVHEFGNHYIKTEPTDFEESLHEVRGEKNSDKTLSINVQCHTETDIKTPDTANKVHTWNEEQIGSCISIPESHVIAEDFLTEIPQDLINTDNELQNIPGETNYQSKHFHKLVGEVASLNKDSKLVDIIDVINKSAFKKETNDVELFNELSDDYEHIPLSLKRKDEKILKASNAWSNKDIKIDVLKTGDSLHGESNTAKEKDHKYKDNSGRKRNDKQSKHSHWKYPEKNYTMNKKINEDDPLRIQANSPVNILEKKPKFQGDEKKNKNRFDFKPKVKSDTSHCRMKDAKLIDKKSPKSNTKDVRLTKNKESPYYNTKDVQLTEKDSSDNTKYIKLKEKKECAVYNTKEVKLTKNKESSVSNTNDIKITEIKDSSASNTKYIELTENKKSSGSITKYIRSTDDKESSVSNTNDIKITEIKDSSGSNTKDIKLTENKESCVSNTKNIELTENKKSSGSITKYIKSTDDKKSSVSNTNDVKKRENKLSSGSNAKDIKLSENKESSVSNTKYIEITENKKTSGSNTKYIKSTENEESSVSYTNDVRITEIKDSSGSNTKYIKSTKNKESSVSNTSDVKITENKDSSYSNTKSIELTENQKSSGSNTKDIKSTENKESSVSNTNDVKITENKNSSDNNTKDFKLTENKDSSGSNTNNIKSTKNKESSVSNTKDVKFESSVSNTFDVKSTGNKEISDNDTKNVKLMEYKDSSNRNAVDVAFEIENNCDLQENNQPQDNIFINICEKVKSGGRKREMPECFKGKEKSKKWIVDGLEIKNCKVNLIKLEKDDIEYICREFMAGHKTEYANYLYSMQKVDAQNFDQLINGAGLNMKPRKYKRILEICGNLFRMNKHFHDKKTVQRKRGARLSGNGKVKRRKSNQDFNFDWIFDSDDSSLFEDEVDIDLEDSDPEQLNDVLVCPEPDCGRSFVSAVSLEHHISRVHGDDGEYTERKICPVDDCDKSYSTKHNLMKHIRRDHGDDVYQKIQNELYGLIEPDTKPVAFRPAGTCLMPTVWRKPQPLIPPHVQEKISKTSQNEPPKNVKEVEDIKNILSDFTQNGKGSFYSILSNK